MNASRFLNDAGTGDLVKLEILFDDGTPEGTVRMGVYADDGGKPGALLLDAGETAVANGWVAIDGLSLPVTRGAYYWLAFVMDAYNGVRQGSPADSNIHWWYASPDGPLPDPMGKTGSDARPYVMRATIASGP